LLERGTRGTTVLEKVRFFEDSVIYHQRNNASSTKKVLAVVNLNVKL
jgi:hypothetical protein